MNDIPPVLNGTLHLSVQCLHLRRFVLLAHVLCKCWQQQPFFWKWLSSLCSLSATGQGQGSNSHPWLLVGKKHLSWERAWESSPPVYKMEGLWATHCSLCSDKPRVCSYLTTSSPLWMVDWMNTTFLPSSTLDTKSHHGVCLALSTFLCHLI